VDWFHKSQSNYEALLNEHKAKSILEIGSGANPTFTPEYVRDKRLFYVTSDADGRELEKADAAFQRLVLDLSVNVTDPNLSGKFDFVLSRMVNEHVNDGELYHKNIYNMLKLGGISAHCFSTLWNLPLAANRFLPKSLSEFLLDLYSPRDKHHNGRMKILLGFD
jgi:2-polyprenyl-3-methyl-5-hydroxy-6-metoxy-1,4-benzoquinol methylase